jgi:hypothetical protein
VLSARGALAREGVAGPYRLLVLGPEAPRRALARAGWRGSASGGAATAPRAVDGDAGTRWTAEGPVDGTVSFTLALDRPRRLTGLRLVPGSREGGPAEFVLAGSADGQAWQPLEPTTWAGPLFWTGAELLRNSRPGMGGDVPAGDRALPPDPAGGPRVHLGDRRGHRLRVSGAGRVTLAERPGARAATPAPRRRRGRRGWRS